MIPVRPSPAAGPLLLLGALVAGILTGDRLGAGAARGALAAGAVLAAGGLARRGPVGLALGMAGIATLGVAVTQRAHDGLVRSPLTSAVAARADVTLTGMLVDDPDGGPYTARVLVRADTVAVEGARGAPAGGRTLLVTAGGDAGARLRLLSAGDRVALEGWLQPLDGYDLRLLRRHAVASLDATDLVDFAGPASPLHRLANRLRGLVVNGGESLPATERAVLVGFLLGDTRAVPPDVETDFRAAGLTHLLAVSGANVAFVLALAAPLLRTLGLRGRLLGGLAVLLVFGTMTRWEPSVLRACAMAACSMTALHVGRPTAGLRVLALAAAALLLADPFLLHSVGFLLSCGATGGIAVLAAPLSERLPGPAWARDALAVTAAAQVGVAPVMLPVFGSLPLVALPANLLAVPLAAPLTAWGLVSSVAAGSIGRWWPGAAAALHAPTRALVRAVIEVADLGARVPMRVDGRAAWAIVALAALLAAVRRGSTLPARCPRSGSARPPTTSRRAPSSWAS